MENTSYGQKDLLDNPKHKMIRRDAMLGSTIPSGPPRKPPSKFKPALKGKEKERDTKTKAKTTPQYVDLDSSEDEADLLNGPSSPHKKKQLPPRTEERAPVMNQYSALGLRFHKNSDAQSQKTSSQPDATTSSSAQKSQSSTSRDQDVAGPSKPRTLPYRPSTKQAKSSTGPTKSSTTRSNPFAAKSSAKPSSVMDISDGETESNAYNDPPKATSRPRPKPSWTKRVPASPTTSPKKLAKRIPAPFPPLSPVGSPPPFSKDKGKKKDLRTAAPPPWESFSPLRNTTAAKKKGKNGSLPTPSSSSQSNSGSKPKSKDGSDDSARSSAFPMPSPLSKPSRRAPAAFPMALSPAPTPRSNKRLSDDSDDDKSRKRRRDESSSPMTCDGSNITFAHAEDDALFLGTAADPKTLCPYCDEPLPPSPTSLLRKMLASLAKKSKSFPRPMNPLGRKAPVEAFIPLCQRHRFESELLPEAEKKGWPKEIEFDKLEARVRGLRTDLRGFLCDPEVRNASKFWKEVMLEVKNKGSRAVGGVQNQFANFEKMQPGYYGEQGSVIIQHTLYDLFPPSSINQTFIKPLTANEYVQRILVPEVAVKLIMGDQNSSYDKAVAVLRESSNYGVAMFPEDGGEWGEKKHRKTDDDMGVADKMIMERARKRRIELEKEEEEEDNARKKDRPKPKPLGRKKTDTMSSIPDVPMSDDIPLDIDDHPLGSDMSMSPASSPPPNGVHDREPSWSTSLRDNGDLFGSSESEDDELPAMVDLKKKKGKGKARAAPSRSNSRASSRSGKEDEVQLRKYSQSDVDSSDSGHSRASQRRPKAKARSESVEIVGSSTRTPKRATSAMDVDDATPRPTAALAGSLIPLNAARRRTNAESYDWLLDS